MDDARIQDFRKMVEADPENELGHFSLGQALLSHGQYEEAIKSLEKVLEINMQNSRAYHLLALSQRGAGDNHGAISTLRIGFDIAQGRGDMKVRNEIAALMTELGDTPPQVEDEPAAGRPRQAVGEGQLTCNRCGQVKSPLAKAPFKGPLGDKVLAGVCSDCWREWIHMGTKVINELRLDFANPRDGETYDMHMKEFLNLD